MNQKKSLKFILFAGLLFSCFACATTQSARVSPQEQAYAGKDGVVEIYGPPKPAAPETYGPERPSQLPIVLVLGPGLARGYAYAGVFRALTEARIPIAAILGTEMGSLMGALYATRGSINDFEWALLKLKKEVFIGEEGGFFSKYFNPKKNDKKLHETLEEIFGTKKLENSKIQLRVALQNEKTQALSVLSSGNAVDILRAALGTPGIFFAAPWRGESFVSATRAKPFLVTEARAIGAGPVVVFDLISTAPVFQKQEVDSFMSEAAKNAEEELRGASLVIRPDLRDIGYLDFDKQTDAAYRGKQAVLSHLDEIKNLMSGQKTSESR